MAPIQRCEGPADAGPCDSNRTVCIARIRVPLYNLKFVVGLRPLICPLLHRALCQMCAFFDEPPHIPMHKKQRPENTTVLSAPAVIPCCTSRPAVSMVLSTSSLIFPRRAPSPHQSYSSGTLQDYPSASETLCCGQTYRPLWARFDHRGQSCKRKICKTISIEQQERT